MRFPFLLSFGLALPLLVARIFTNDAHNPAAADYFALVADLLH
jgi:hypothetical protein